MWKMYYSDEAEECVTLDNDTDLVRCSSALARTRKCDQYYWVVDQDIDSGYIGTINKAHNTWKEHMTKELREELVVVLSNLSM